MTKYGYYYTYNFCNTSLLGEYVVNGCSDLSCWAYDFEVNPTGAQTSTFQGLLYALFLFILMGLFGLFLYGSFAIPSENVESPEGTLLKINWKKYARWMCFVFTWLIGLWISFVCWNLSYAFAFFSTMEDIFEVIFTTYSAVSLVVIPVFVIYMVVQAVQDWKINEMIERNLTVRL
jgi:uncharacterized membrane protein YobD (UPF0266 family)